MMSEFEVDVTLDMLDNGYNPNDKNSVQQYWKDRLDEPTHIRDLHQA